MELPGSRFVPTSTCLPEPRQMCLLIIGIMGFRADWPGFKIPAVRLSSFVTKHNFLKLHETALNGDDDGACWGAAVLSLLECSVR